MPVGLYSIIIAVTLYNHHGVARIYDIDDELIITLDFLNRRSRAAHAIIGRYIINIIIVACGFVNASDYSISGVGTHTLKKKRSW